MRRAIIDVVAAAGFHVYMHDGNTDDSYLYFTDGKRIGYLQQDRLEGFCLTTVHVPTTSHGTGFSVARDVPFDEIPSKLVEALATAPSWAPNRDREQVQKFKDFAAFRNQNGWNARFRLVAAGAGLPIPTED